MFVCDHELSLGGLWLHGAGVDLQDGHFSFDLSADDELEFGSYEAVQSVVDALWADGSSVTRERDDNATTTFYVLVEGESLTALADGAAALRRSFPEPGKSVDLVWRAGDGAPAALRTVLDATMQFDSEGVEDEGELLQRTYRVTLTHAPFVRSEFETTVEALTVGEVPTVETVDAFTSASAWSFSSGRPSTPSVTVAGGVLKGQATHTGSNVRSQYSWNLSRATAITMGAETPYLIVEHRVLGGTVTNPGFRLFGMDWPAGAPIDRAHMLRWVSGGLTVDGWTRTVFYAPGGVGRLTLGAATSFSAAVAVPRVEVRALQRSSSPSQFTGRALQRHLDIGGTERSPGALRIRARDGSTGLGTVLVHTCPDLGDGYTPDLFVGDVTATTTVAGSDSPSGNWYDLNPSGNVTTRLDGARFEPGTYALVAWVKGHATDSYGGFLVGSVASSGRMGTPTLNAESIGVPLTLASNEIRAVVIGQVTLPGVRSKVGGVSVTISAASTSRPKVGGVWAFRVGRDCALSVVTTNQPHLWLTSSSLATPRGVAVSDVNDRAQAWDPGAAAVQQLGSHQFRPPRALAYVVTGGATDAAVDFTYWKLWPDHPADDGSQP